MITSFSGNNKFLSNFYPAEVYFENVKYASSEHAYVAAKTLDEKIRVEISNIESPGAVKRFGRTILLRPNWELVKISCMRTILESKFSNKILMDLLNSTKGKLLVEGNSWGDTFWGQSPLGIGKNELGKILMSIRDNVQNKL